MVDKEILEKCYGQAIETIKGCSTKHGLYASGGPDGYKGVWARDSMITLICASSDKDVLFKDQFKRSLSTLGKYQSKTGEIPNAIMNLERKKAKVDFKSIDSSLWFVIGHYFYRKRYRDKSLFEKNEKKIKKAILWIKQRDFGSDVTLEQLPTTDWQDAFPHKYGVVINTQALYYLLLKLIKEEKTAKRLKYIINKDKENSLWGEEFYWAYRWKNHNKYKEIGKWFGSLGNLFAILFGLSEKKYSERILRYIKKKKINQPYPLKAIFPPIDKKSEYWKDYYLDAGATPNKYLNGGIWPYIGGFYVLALIKLKKYKDAERELIKLAESNLKGDSFPEWIDPTTKKPYGKLQAWDAGTYIAAYNSFKKKKLDIKW